MTSDLVASSPIPHQLKNLSYDVFLSFRGEDTRDNFVSHLHKALSNHQIKTFIDYNFTRGADFAPALFPAIEESLISIIILSENYAGSTWCLKELAKIMECKNSIEQIVLPVFYRVDPSDVRNQTGNFGAAFDRLQECSKGKINFDDARSHLKEVTDISGWDSRFTRPETQLITEIVGDVLHKLHLFSFSYSTNLVGVFPHVNKVESLLSSDASDVSVVGIWGMGGIGKSTIAREVFNHICQEFDASHFVSNLQDELKRQSLDIVRDRLLLKIFEKECLTMDIQTPPDLIRRQLPQKKVFIVLDDVNDSIQLKELLEGQNYWFDSGSKILITSRDRQVLKNVTDKIHTMEAMNEKDAMMLFSLNAFKQKYPTNSYKELSKRAIYYAKGNPLALVVLGSALFDRSKEFWVSALEGLEKEPNFGIQNVLRFSYDTLSPGEKKIFLDIACFLCGSPQYFINQYYGYSEIFKIKTLEDKCLVSISSFNTIEMHDLLKEIGQSIDRENYLDKPKKRMRLWNPKDVCGVLTKKTGDAKIEALSMDMWKNKEVHLDGDVFVGESLQFVKFFDSNVSATNKREPLGENLLPPETPEIVYGDHSGFEIKLTGKELSELPKAEEWKVSKGIHLNDSHLLLKLPENPRCPVLEDLSLKGNSKLRTIPPLFFDWMPALRVLDLSRTRIKSLPDSLFSLPELKRLFLRHCNLLMKLSPKVGQLKGLQVLDLEGTEIMNLPEEVKELENLMCLKVSFCELPSYRRVEEPDVLMISPGTLSALPMLEELSINVSPDDGRWNECVELVVSEVSGLACLYKLQFYFPSMEFLSHFQWFRFKAFKLTAGHLAAKRLMPRLPSDAEAELERYDKSFTSVHGDFESEMNNPVLQHADALFLDRHTTMKTLSMFGLDSFKHIRCCVVGECNELQVLFCVAQPPHVSLEYLYLYYMKSLRSIWKGNVAPHAFLNLKSLTLRTCPLLSSIFTLDSIGILKSLLEIIIDDCPAITTLVSCYTAHNFLPSLKRISLHYLPQLNGIFDLSLSRDLEWMSIYHCPNLKSLPIDTAWNENLKKIMGDRSWWESLEWQDTKQHSWDDVFVEQELCY